MTTTESLITSVSPANAFSTFPSSSNLSDRNKPSTTKTITNNTTITTTTSPSTLSARQEREESKRKLLQQERFLQKTYPTESLVHIHAKSVILVYPAKLISKLPDSLILSIFPLGIPPWLIELEAKTLPSVQSSSYVRKEKEELTISKTEGMKWAKLTKSTVESEEEWSESSDDDDDDFFKVISLVFHYFYLIYSGIKNLKTYRINVLLSYLT